MKYYFVSYSYSSNGSFGFGHCVQSLNTKSFNISKSVELINEINSDTGQVVIMNYKELTKEEYKEMSNEGK